VDPREHARFLEYLERYEYFRRPGVAKLDRDQFAALDREHRALKARGPDADPARETALRALLFRD